MEHRKHGARLFGLLIVMALGVMAFAASAQAVVPGFLIGGKAFAALTKVTGKAEGSNTMLVPGLNFKMSCTSFTTDEGAIESKTDAILVLLFTGCTTLSISKSPEEIHCHVTEPIRAEGLILPAELTKPVLNGPAGLVEKIKALVKLHLPEASLGVTPCVLPLDNVLTGEVCFEIKEKTNDTIEPLIYTDASVECKVKTVLEGGTEGSGTIKDVAKYGAQTVTFDGAALLLATNPIDATLGVSLY